MDDDEDDMEKEVTFDYSDQNDGKTHMLVVEFPEGVTEKAFLIALKYYLKAQYKILTRNGNKDGLN